MKEKINQLNENENGETEIVGTLIETNGGIINCQYKRCKSIPNTKPGKRIVVTAGYIPLKNRIENMIQAGINLQATREMDYPEQYFTDEELDDDDIEDDEISIMNKGNAAEDKLLRRKRYIPRSGNEEFGHWEDPRWEEDQEEASRISDVESIRNHSDENTAHTRKGRTTRKKDRGGYSEGTLDI